MTILMTGSTGLVGEHLLCRLISTEEEYRVLLRVGKRAPVGARVVEGELFDRSSLNEAVSGVSAIIHLAAVFRTDDTDLIWKSNVEGTRNLIAAAMSHA